MIEKWRTITKKSNQSCVFSFSNSPVVSKKTLVGSERRKTHPGAQMETIYLFGQVRHAQNNSKQRTMMQQL